jgi:hypothetical protein
MGSSSVTFDPPFFCQFACLTNNHGSFHDPNRSFDPNLKFRPSTKEQWGQLIGWIMRWHPNIVCILSIDSSSLHHHHHHHHHKMTITTTTNRWGMRSRADTMHVCTHTLKDERGGGTNSMTTTGRTPHTARMTSGGTHNDEDEWRGTTWPQHGHYDDWRAPMAEWGTRV